MGFVASRMLGVTMLPAALDVVADGSMDGLEVGYVGEDGTQHRLPLADRWAVRFEAMAPVRRFASRKGQRHLPWRWWSASPTCSGGPSKAPRTDSSVTGGHLAPFARLSSDR
jgi:hypothetical protein